MCKLKWIAKMQLWMHHPRTNAIRLIFVCIIALLPGEASAIDLLNGSFSIEQNLSAYAQFSVDANEVAITDVISGAEDGRLQIDSVGNNSAVLTIPSIGDVPYVATTATTTQMYPGDPLFYRLEPQEQIDTAPTLTRLWLNINQPDDIVLNHGEVMNLEKYVSPNVLEHKWRLVIPSENSEAVRTILEKSGIAGDQIDQLTFDSAGANGTHVFDVDVDDLNAQQMQTLTTIPSNLASGYSPRWQSRSFQAKLVFDETDDIQNDIDNKLGAPIEQHIRSLGINADVLPGGGGSYSSGMLYHLTTIREDIRSQSALGRDRTDVWIFHTIHVSFIVSSEQKVVAFFLLTDLRCRFASPGTPPDRPENMGNDCYAQNITPYSLGGILLATLASEFSATTEIVQ